VTAPAKSPVQVGVQGRTLRMARAGAPVSVGERLGEGGQGVVHAALIGGANCAVKWYRARRAPEAGGRG
jgi:hypothetical protein